MPILRVLAASLALVAVGLAFWGVRQRAAVEELRREVAGLSQPLPNIPIIDLYPDSSLRSTAPEVPESLVAATGEGGAVGYAAFVLFLPEPPDLAAYEAALVDQEDHEVRRLSLQMSEVGTFNVGLPLRFLEAGEHRILLYGIEGEERRLLETFPLPLAKTDGSP